MSEWILNHGYGEHGQMGCVVCQACEHPKWAMKGRYDRTPIPEAPLTSVCVDIFTLSETVAKQNI